MANKRAHGEGSIFRRKDGLWQGAVTIGYTPEGKQNRKTIYGRTQGDVRAKIDGLRSQLTQGILNQDHLTVGSLIHRWLKEKAKQVKPRTTEMYTDLARLHITPRIGQLKLDRVHPLHIQDLVSDVAEKVGVPTANKCRRLLFGVMKQAVRWQLLPRNPVEAVDPLKEEQAELILWTLEQATRFLDTATGHRLYAGYYLTMACGMRRGEVLGLKWDDLEGDRVTIRRTLTYRGGKPAWSTPKTAKGKRIVIVPQDAMLVLSEHRKRQASERSVAGLMYQDEDLIFASELGGITSPAAFHHHWVRLQERAGVPRQRLHDMRHLHVSLLVQRGLDPRAIADRVGHSDPAFTLRRYSHLFEAQRQQAAVSLRDLLGDTDESSGGSN